MAFSALKQLENWKTYTWTTVSDPPSVLFIYCASCTELKAPPYDGDKIFLFVSIKVIPYVTCFQAQHAEKILMSVSLILVSLESAVTTRRAPSSVDSVLQDTPVMGQTVHVRCLIQCKMNFIHKRGSYNVLCVCFYFCLFISLNLNKSLLHHQCYTITNPVTLYYIVWLSNS